MKRFVLLLLFIFNKKINLLIFFILNFLIFTIEKPKNVNKSAI